MDSQFKAQLEEDVLKAYNHLRDVRRWGSEDGINLDADLEEAVVTALAALRPIVE